MSKYKTSGMIYLESCFEFEDFSSRMVTTVPSVLKNELSGTLTFPEINEMLLRNDTQLVSTLTPHDKTNHNSFQGTFGAYSEAESF